MGRKVVACLGIYGLSSSLFYWGVLNVIWAPVSSSMNRLFLVEQLIEFFQDVCHSFLSALTGLAVLLGLIFTSLGEELLLHTARQVPRLGTQVLSQAASFSKVKSGLVVRGSVALGLDTSPVGSWFVGVDDLHLFVLSEHPSGNVLACHELSDHVVRRHARVAFIPTAILQRSRRSPIGAAFIDTAAFVPKRTAGSRETGDAAIFVLRAVVSVEPGFALAVKSSAFVCRGRIARPFTGLAKAVRIFAVFSSESVALVTHTDARARVVVQKSTDAFKAISAVAVADASSFSIFADAP